MIATIGSGGNLLSRAADDSAAVRRQLDLALGQQASGKVSDTYSGLGTGTRTSLDVRPAVQHMETWQSNIDVASRRMEVTQSALRQIASIAEDLHGKTNSINQIGTSEASSVAVEARLALQQVAQLLNTRDGAGNYVFAGDDSGNPPVPDTDPTVLAAALLASDTDPAPFSTTIGTAPPRIEIGDGQFVATGVLANQNTLATSATPTTGSYMRDVMRALASLTTVTDGPGADAAAADVRTRLDSAIAAMADETGALGDIQASLTTRKTTLETIQTAFSHQVSDAEDVDMAATLTKVSALQTQLQASYQVMASLKNLSLSAYL